MALPLLVPLIGGLIGTAAAPALGIGAATAAGLGSGIASLAAGADPGEALLAGLTGGIGSKVLPGIIGAAGKGGEVATAAATQAAAQGAGPAAAQGLGLSTQDLLKIAGRAVSSSSGPVAQAPMPQAAPMNLSGGQPSGVAIPQMAQPDPATAPTATSAAVPPVVQSVLPPVQPQGVEPVAQPQPQPGIARLAEDEMRRNNLSSLPNLGDPNVAYPLASYARGGFAAGGFVEGPGTGTSDDIPAMIYQDGEPVQEAALSDGEFVMTADAVKGAGGGDRNKGAAEMYRMMRQFEERAA